MEDRTVPKASRTVAMTSVETPKNGYEKNNVISSDVPKKYMGTEADLRDILMLGKR